MRHKCHTQWAALARLAANSDGYHLGSKLGKSLWQAKEFKVSQHMRQLTRRPQHVCVCIYVCVCVCLYVCLLSYCSCKCWCTKRDLHDKLPNAREYLMHCVTWVNKDENKESLWARKAFEIRFYYAHLFIKKWEPKNSLKYDFKTFIFLRILWAK